MLRDVFYYGKKPNVHPRERLAYSFDHCRELATTEHFWIINEFCDYTNFDWDFDFETLPDEDVWAQDHINIWPSQHQKDSGTWLVANNDSQIKIYRNDVDIVRRKNIVTEQWKFVEDVDTNAFDFSWHPDPTDPPFIYKWGCKFYPVEVQAVLEYHVTNAKQVKYMTEEVKLFQSQYLTQVQEVDGDKFDLGWRPDPREPAFIYVWGNKHIPGNIKPTLIYSTPNATQYKYLSDDIPVKPEWDNYFFLKDIDESSFDFTWRPDPREPPFIYVFGNTQYSSEKMPTMYYIVEGATQKKYTDINVRLKPKPELFEKFEDFTDFDYSWTPDPYDPPYIYAWGNQYNSPAYKISVQYIVKGATDYKYMDKRVKRTASSKHWHFVIPIIKDSFDFSWEPPANDPPYIYVFGNTYNDAATEPTLEYHVPNATERKFVNEFVAKPKPNKNNFEILLEIEDFDFSWRPNPHDPPFVYVFGNTQYPGEVMPTVLYIHKEGTEKKYIPDVLAKLKQTPELFTNTRLVKSFDYSWRPDPRDPPYIYQFGTQWQKTNGPVYTVQNATEIKYVEKPLAIIGPTTENWDIPKHIDVDNFDFSWHPDSTSPPYIYQFGTKIDENDGPRYVVPNNDGTIVKLLRLELNQNDVPKYTIKTSLQDLIEEHSDEVFWALSPSIDYTDFDFTWRPDHDSGYYISAFGDKNDLESCTFFVNAKMVQRGHRIVNFINVEKDIVKEHEQVFDKCSMFFIDMGNKSSNENFEKLKLRYPDIIKTRFLNNIVDTIYRCIKKSISELCWILDSNLDYSEFNFNYYPNAWQMKMVHVFGTQWNHWGSTYLINTNSFPHDTRYVKKIEHLPNINFVKQRRAKAVECIHDIYVIDFELDNIDIFTKDLQEKTGMVKQVVKYENNLLTTLKPIIENVTDDYFAWIVCSLSDYTDFDFSYIVDPFATEQLHTFPCNNQKYGDTIFVNLKLLKDNLENLERLENFSEINFNQSLRTKRLACPTVITNNDTHSDFKKYEYNFPYATFITHDNDNIDSYISEPMSIWSDSSKQVIVHSTGATCITIPSVAKRIVQKELYDYPYILTSKQLLKSRPLDIVFLSNNEKCADENYEHLLSCTQGYQNRIVRVDGVNGRVLAYHEAAKVSNTPWLFTVFAKLKVNQKFDWNWQPDRLQKPKHYIFHALNPLNGLVYGHQAMIAYNKKLVLSNNGSGLDFTLDSEHEVVKINSGIAMYNTDEFSTWRTAFRESIKLSNSELPVDKVRLDVWCEKAEGNFAEYSLKGANDGVEYFDEVKGDLEKLKLSYDWPWCKQYFYNKYSNIK